MGPFLYPSKDRYLVPRRLREVIVDGEENHEAEEEAPRREEVPDVVVVVEVEQPAIKSALQRSPKNLVLGCVNPQGYLDVRFTHLRTKFIGHPKRGRFYVTEV